MKFTINVDWEIKPKEIESDYEVELPTRTIYLSKTLDSGRKKAVLTRALTLAFAETVHCQKHIWNLEPYFRQIGEVVKKYKEEE